MTEDNLVIYFTAANALKDLEELKIKQEQILSKINSHYDIWLDVFKYN